MSRKKFIITAGSVCLAILVIFIGIGVYKRMYCGINFVKNLYGGINLGNSLDVEGLCASQPDATVEDYETYWDNPVLTKELIETIYERGFRTLRLPVSWGEHMDESGQVSREWMARVKQVTDWALDTGLYVILDTHHEKWLIPSPEQEIEVTEHLCSLWEQIAECFRNKDERLLFEGMNEPRVVGAEEEWKGGTVETRQVVNRLNEAFVRTVRDSGGGNRHRWLLISTYGSSSEREALEDLMLPADSRLIVTVHAYIPYRFTHEGDDEWKVDDLKDTEKIDSMLNDLEELFLKKRIPVVITEFGCRKKSKEEVRLTWAHYYLQQAGKRGIPCIWWDNGKEMRIIDREDYVWTEERLAGLLVSVEETAQQ